MATVTLSGEEEAILGAALDYGAACLARNRSHTERDAIARDVTARGEYIAANAMIRHPLYRAVVASNRAEAQCASMLLVLEAALSALPAENFVRGTSDPR